MNFLCANGHRMREGQQFCAICGEGLFSEAPIPIRAPGTPTGQNWFVVAMLVVLFPVGLYLMWRRSAWLPKTKTIVTAALAGLLVISIARGSSSPAPVSKHESAPITTLAIASDPPPPPPARSTAPAPKPKPPSPKAVAPKPVVKAPAPAPTPAAPKCHPSYSGVCLRPDSPDYDCAGGSGDGPDYVQGPFKVVGPDEYGLDRDHDGIGCE